MALFVLSALLTLSVVVILIRPLLRELDAPGSAEPYNTAVYRDQLQELRREKTRQDNMRQDGPPGPAVEDLASARLEIERRLLGANRRSPDGAVRQHAAPTMIAVLVAGGLSLSAGVIYLALGDPTAPDHPLRPPPPSSAEHQTRPDLEAAPVGSTGTHAEMDQMVASLASKMQAHPKDPDGWSLLARSLMRLDRPAAAVDAYRHAIAVTPQPNAQLDAEYAEARVIAAGGVVDPEALRLFQRLLAADTANPQARYYLALAKAQTGDVGGGLADWRALQAASPKDAPWMETLRRRIADAETLTASQAEKGQETAPPLNDASGSAATSLSDTDHTRLIGAMVDGLAARLRRSPDDLNGWRELARADAVLGRQSQASIAERQIRRLEQASR